MKIPLSWLREYVTFEQSADELAHLLTIAGLEVTGIENTGEHWDKVFVGLVREVNKHPNADKLVLATIEYGGGKITVVTGAPNIAAGQKVALALEGAVLWDTYSETPRKKKLKGSNIRGIRSEGMACSERELGLSDEHEGILVLSEDSPVGAPLADYLGDHILDLDLTPNFAYASSVVGLAREISAITGGELHLPEVPPLPVDKPGTSVRVDPELGLARYMLQKLDNISVKPSSSRIQARLTACGLRAINNVVDVTNYVMMEYGQPLHPFDADATVGEVQVRAPHPGERFETLDHQIREMPPRTAMIADDEKAIGIGGIMGGLRSEVTGSTTCVLLESATFNAPQIRRSSRAMGLRTDASSRFEKRVDSELAALALARAVDLLCEEAGAVPVGGPADWYPEVSKPDAVTLHADQMTRLLGMEIPITEAKRILDTLGFETSLQDSSLAASPPSFRSDVERPADLIEEIGRIWGYDNIVAELPAGELPVQRTDNEAIVERRTREWLARAGLQEVINYDLTSLQALESLCWFTPELGGPVLWQPQENLLKILNPLSHEHEYLRTSLLPELLGNVRENLKHEDRVWLFELDRVFASRGSGELPDEPKRLGLVIAGVRRPKSALADSGPVTIHDLKGVVEAMFRALHIDSYSLRAAAYLGAGAINALAVELNGKVIGWIFQLAPDLLLREDIEQRVFAAELSWDPIVAGASLVPEFKPFSRYPAVRQDVAVVVSENTPAGDVESTISSSGGRYLAKVSLAEVYRGRPLEDGQKSLLYNLAFQANDRTLTEKEANKYRQNIEHALQASLDARIRGADTS